MRREKHRNAMPGDRTQAAHGATSRRLLAAAHGAHTVAAMLARAFFDDPAMTFIFPDPEDRLRRLPRLFAILYDGDGAHGMRYATDGGEAATLWRGPGMERLSLQEMVMESFAWVHAAGPSLGRALAYSFASDAAHPKEPHWYLHVAGCDPGRQGRGFGRAAIEAGLRRADADGVTAYLETAKPGNVGYYESLGFGVTHRWTVCMGTARELVDAPSGPRARVNARRTSRASGSTLALRASNS